MRASACIFASHSETDAPTAPTAPTTPADQATGRNCSKVPGGYELCNPLAEKGEVITPPQVIGKVINIFTGISGSLALLMFVYGGFLMMTSRGNAEQITKGKSKITQAITGLVIIFGSYIILQQIFKMLGVTA